MLDNGVVRVVIDAQRPAHVPDRPRHRARGHRPRARSGNRLQLHRDIPNEWDAWDVDEHYRRNVTELDEVAAVELDAQDDRAVVRVRPSFGSSHDRAADHRWRPGAESVEIANDVDWQEAKKLLKLGFGLDVHADRSASETQFGHVFRPTHTNTSWESARFEICAHRWIHVAEPGYGVAVSNDSTYGHDVGRTTRADAAGPPRPSGSRWCAGPSIPIRKPIRAGTRVGSRSGPARRSPTPSRRATGRTCRRGRSAALRTS